MIDLRVLNPGVIRPEHSFPTTPWQDASFIFAIPDNAAFFGEVIEKIHAGQDTITEGGIGYV